VISRPASSPLWRRYCYDRFHVIQNTPVSRSGCLAHCSRRRRCPGFEIHTTEASRQPLAAAIHDRDVVERAAWHCHTELKLRQHPFCASKALNMAESGGGETLPPPGATGHVAPLLLLRWRSRDAALGRVAHGVPQDMETATTTRQHCFSERWGSLSTSPCRDRLHTRPVSRGIHVIFLTIRNKMTV
jgi:hypothetical protein